MKKNWRKLTFRVLIVLVPFVILIASWVVWKWSELGEFRKIHNQTTGKLLNRIDIVGAEDLTIHSSGVVFISSHDRRPWLFEDKVVLGAIYKYDLTHKSPKAVNLTKDIDFTFQPQGISLYVDSNGQTSLFATNHREDGEFVEIFDYSNGELTHRKSITSKLMTDINDLVAIDHNRFYVTNDHGSTSSLGRVAEDVFALAMSYVLYFDGENFTKAAEDIVFANGINFSPDGKMLFVASPAAHKVIVYQRDITTNKLTYLRDILVGTGVDNIELDPQGNLLIGCHPKLWTFMMYALEKNKYSPSEVIVVEAPEYKKHKTIFMDNGQQLSASSTGAVYGNKLFIGSVFDDVLVYEKND